MVVLSLPLAAPEGLRAVLPGRMVMRRQAGTRRHSSDEPELLHMGHAQLHVQLGSGAPGVAGDFYQSTAASVEDCPGPAMDAEDQRTLKMVVAEVDQLRPFVVHLPTQGTGERIQQYVLGVGREIEALTWEGMGSLAVQTYWD